MADSNLYGFLDEFGNSGLDFSKDNVSTHFAIGAIIVQESDIPDIEKALEEIAKKHFSGSEIKSSNVGKNDRRRLRILGEILELRFKIYCMVFDKRQIFGKGLKYKRTFLKYLNNQVFKALYLAFPNIKLIADEHGTKEFMDGFVTYVEKRYQRKTMFEESDFNFVESKSHRLAQLADFIVGTVARCYDETVLSPNSQTFMDSLMVSNRLIPIVEWPERVQVYHDTEEESSNQSDQDNIVFQYSVRIARHFIEENLGSDEQYVRDQIATANYMLFQVLYGNSRKFISTAEFMENLNSYEGMEVTGRLFGRCVIGPLRDAGLLITSSNKGYKLITNSDDTDIFVRYFHHFIKPMLSRLKKCRTNILLATENEVDILQDSEYNYLKRFLDEIGVN